MPVSAVVDVRIDVGGTEFERLVAFPLDGFDGEHITRAGVHRTLQRRHPDAAEADDGHVFTGPDRGRPGRRAPARRHAAADQGRRREGDRRVDLDERGPVHDQVRRIRPEQRVRVDVLAARLNPKRPVGHRCTRHQTHSQVAQIPLTGLARPAFAAGRDERRGDVVTGHEVVDALADFDDDTGTFVTAEHRECGHRDIARDDVMVRVAHARDLECDLDLTPARVADLDLLDRPRLVEVPDQRALGFHRRASS